MPEREQPVGIGIILFQRLQHLFVQGYPDSLHLAFLRFLRHVFQRTVLDIVPCETVKVTHTAADITMEHEDIMGGGQLRVIVQVCIIEDASLFGGEEERAAVDRLLAIIESIDLVVRIPYLLVSVQKGAEQIHSVDDGCAGKRSQSVIDEHAGSVEVGMFPSRQVFIHHIIPEGVYLLQHDGLHGGGEARLVQHLPAVVVIAGRLALETGDILLCSLHAAKLFQMLADTDEQVRMVVLEGADRIQHILDGLPHPPAVRLIREGLLRPLDDGGDLFRKAFLLGGRRGHRALIAEDIGISIFILRLRRGNNLYVRVLIPDFETDVRDLGGGPF